MTSLVKYDAACRALAEAKAVDEVKDLRDKADAMRIYAMQAKNKALEVDAAEIRIRAERRLGEMLAAQKASGGLNQGARVAGAKAGANDGSSAVVSGDRRPKLSDAGISKDLSSRAQKLAAVPAAEFEAEVSEWRERVEEEGRKVTTRLEKAGERAQKSAPDAQPAGLYADDPRRRPTGAGRWRRPTARPRSMPWKPTHKEHAMIDVLAIIVHHAIVAKTKAAWFDSQNVPRRTLRHQADFLRPMLSCASMGGRLQGGFGLPVPLDAGLSTLLSARPPRLTAGSGSNPQTEAAMRANTPARPEQTHFPLIEHAAIEAAELWLQTAPASLADWRDARFHASARVGSFPETVEHKAAFDQAYAARIGQALVGVSHV